MAEEVPDVYKRQIMNITDGNMGLRINSFIGSMNEDIDIDKDGKDIMIGFNPKFFIDALRIKAYHLSLIHIFFITYTPPWQSISTVSSLVYVFGAFIKSTITSSIFSSPSYIKP